MRKTKIVATIGPASESEETLTNLIRAGMDVARFNFSHNSHEGHLKNLQKLRAASAAVGRPVAALLDTRGPEVRLGTFEGGKAELVEGSIFTLTITPCEGNSARAYVNYPGLINDIKVGDKVLLNDGAIELRVQGTDPDDIFCEVINGGIVSDRKGVNVPGVRLSMPFVSEKDRADILFAVEHGVDFIAASFVSRAQDILEVRQVLERQGDHTVKIIAKIENAEGVANIDEILRVSDGIMVARGDMGVEVPFEEVPVLQKLLIKKCYNAGKMVITATQMLESMIYNPRPTRAEAADVANAIYDGTSAVMLSGETAAGKYPVEAVKTMSAIAQRTEADIDYRKRFYARPNNTFSDITSAISHATCTTAYDLGAAAIITVTWSGATARMLSKYRSNIPVIACTHQESTCRQLSLSWGVTPLLIDVKEDTDELFKHAVDVARQAGLVKNGDIVVITAGVPLGISGTTNLLKVQVVGDILVRGMGVNKKSTVGKVCVAHTEEEALASFNDGDILVVPHTSNKLLPILRKASAIVTEAGGMNSHAAIVGMTLDIPVIVFGENATSILKSSTIVEVDAAAGTVSSHTNE